jgi:hypothetical protein
MSPALISTALSLDSTHLLAFVRGATGRPQLELSDWRASLIHGGATTNARVYRVVGQGIDQGHTIPWSLVLKEWHQRDANDGSNAPNYWKREALAYQSGLLTATKTGLRPARCFGVYAHNETTIWLALEDIQAPQPRPWSHSDFAHAAKYLGQFNGSFLHQPLPSQAWLSHDWLRSWVSVCETAILDLPQMLRHPLVRAHVPITVAQEVKRLWEDRDCLLDALDQLPQTLCHRDSFVRNLFVERDANGNTGTIAIDWATLGIGPIGEDVAALIGGSLVFFELEIAGIQDVAAQAIDSYTTGLRSRGWNDEPHYLRLGYTATLALRYGLGSVLDLAIVADDESHTWAEQVLGHTIAELIDNTARNLAFFLACADEARTLCNRG